jgi:uncharacterized membrane protein
VGYRNSAQHAPATKKSKTRPSAEFSHSGYSACLSVSIIAFIFFIAFITVAAVILFAFAFVMTNATFILAAILFVIAILLPIPLPIVTPFLAWIVSHDQVVLVYRGRGIVNVIACPNAATQKSHNA